GNKPINATRHIYCGHFFCKQCIEADFICKCKTPIQPNEICNDHLINSLVSYCSTLAEIIQERDLWNLTTNSNELQLPATTEINSTADNIKYYVPKKNINKQNPKGETKLHIACLKNQEKYVSLLLAAGANPNTKDHNGWTPLQEVVSYGYTNICRLLLECGALPNTSGADNRKALHDAVMNNRLPEAKLLLKYGANKNVYDDHGKRPIDYCQPHSELKNILETENELNNISEEDKHFNYTLNQSYSIRPCDTFIVYALNLREENIKNLDQIVLKHKIKIASQFRSSVTHVIVETNNENVVQLSYNVMIALLRGTWILSTEWIQLCMEMGELFKEDLEIFEVSGAPIKGIPKKARENAESQNPGLFNQCHFYFSFQSKSVYIYNMQLTKDALITLIREGGGTVLKRGPNPEDIKDEEEFIPFHVANEPTHSLYKCRYYIIYMPGKNEPAIKYNMAHIKTLPLAWLIECIEKFTLIDPIQLGL
ncbi:BRCA1-associated RING domain protein 1, partial [Eufriesea mexicana]